MRRIAALTCLVLAGCSGSQAPAQANVETVEFLSKDYEVDKIYRSMLGPNERQLVTLLPADAAPELLWVTGFDAEMVDSDGETPRPQEFMCHSNFGLLKPNIRLFTLSQGQFHIEFPPGFGMPVMSNQQFSLETQVLNLNHPEGAGRVRHKIEVRFIRDANLVDEITPLYVTHAFAEVAVGDEPAIFGVEHPDEMTEIASCLPGKPASTDSVRKDRTGRVFSGHFVVPPGRHEYPSLVTRQLGLKYDTSVHYIAVHLHPFAESVSLRDLTTGETVYTAYAKQAEGQVGLAHVDYFESAEGLALFKDHEYEIRAVYDNTSGERMDSMAVLLLYTRWRDWMDPRKVMPGLGAAGG